MIFTERTISVQKGTSSINDTIVLYRGDKNVEVRFTLNEGSPFKFGSGESPNIIEKTEAAYGQLVIKTPNDLPSIFSEVAPTNEGKIIFTITGDMIDEITEVGNYTFQIRLFDENMNSRATIPEVVNGIEIREPIATEDVTDTNEVGIAAVGYALTTVGASEDAFDTEGNYNKTTWGTGDRITAAKLNKIEVAIDGVNKKVASGGTGGNADLSGYVTKETGNANQITFSDGQTFQAKLDAGTLKGEKGDKGDKGDTGEQGAKGEDGLTTQVRVNGTTYTQVDGVITLPDYPASVGESSHTHSNKDILDTITADNVHTHSNKAVIDTITSDMTTKWNKSIPFEDSYVSDCNAWVTNGYTKTNPDTANHPSVCTGEDRWGVLFYIAENEANRTGTQTYFPVNGDYAGRIFTRRMLQGEPGAWNLVSTFDGNYDSLTNKPTIPTVVTSANGITIADTANNFTSTNVEGALAELFQSVSNGKTLIASAITDMGVATSNTDSFEVMANNIRMISGSTGEQPLYKFGLLSDVHVDGDGSDEASSISDLNNAISFLQNAGANFIAYAGDMTYNGRTEDYTALKTCLQASTVPNYCVRGNHDAYSLADGYASATGCKDDYIVTQGNDLLIFISCADTNHDTGGLTTSKLDWLENLLQTNTNTRVFLFYHYFVEGTSGNAGGNYPWGSLNPSNAIALRFINMVKQYPNLIYCNGHSHIRFNLQDQYPNANYYHNNGECYYIHIPSGAKPRYLSGDTVADYNEGSEGYLVEVYADKVIFKPIDFIASEYLTKYNYTANVTQGTNEPTIPAEPTTIDITWNDGIKIDKTTGAESSSSKYSASDFIAYDSSKTYTLTHVGAVTNNTNVFVCYYASDKTYISCGSEYVGTYKLSADVFTIQLPVVDNASYIKLRYYCDTDASSIDKSIITLTSN